MTTENQNQSQSQKQTRTESTAESAHETTASKLLFDPGQVVATPGALEAMQKNQCLSLDLLLRHLTGDWGTIPKEDAKANRQALKEGSRLMSSYPLDDGARVWVITEADRSSTTFLLPEEY
ncbi:MAG: type I restriction endonuclease subunit M [Methylovulum sp.]|nr:type I restriction endonuclease subunit M [Methylovulum sp.]